MCGHCGSLAVGHRTTSAGRGRIPPGCTPSPEPTRRRAPHRDPRRSSTRASASCRTWSTRRDDGPYDDLPVVVDFRDDRGDRAHPSSGSTRGGVVTGADRRRHRRRPSSPRTRAAASCSSRPRRARAAILDAGLTPGRHRRDGHVHASTRNDELELMRNLGIRAGHAGGRARPAAARAPAPRCSTRPRRWPRARPTRCSCTARSTSGRATASANRTPRRQGAAAARLVPHRSASTRRRRCTRSGSSATCTRTASPTRTSAGTRSSAASTRPPTPRPGSTTGRSRSTTTRRRAGSSSRSCACSTAARRATAASRSS